MFPGAFFMPSFDIVSKTDMAFVDNAISNVARDISQRFDFKGSNCRIERVDQNIVILADDETRLRQIHDLIGAHFTRQKIDLKALDHQPKERAAGDAIRQTIIVKQGVDKETAKKLIKEIKDSKLKVQVSIQGDELRVSAKKIDDLQSVIALVKKLDAPLPLQFENQRA
ncbi:UPF0234 protein [Alphaproteobacteria bacterium]|nr:UPF0234 protein [Alphaproteobacteria bacterium]